MIHERSWLAPMVLALVLTAPTSSCIAAVGAAAGAAGAIAYTERGAETELDATAQEIAAATEAVFAESEIQVTGRDAETDGSRVQVRGEQDDTEVTVDIEREGDGLTRVRVVAKKGVVDYDRERAREILRRIVERV